MQISNFRLVSMEPAVPGAAVTVALFNAAITPELTIANMKLRKKPDGDLKIEAPRAFGEPAALMRRPLVNRIHAAAVAAYKGICIDRFSH